MKNTTKIKKHTLEFVTNLKFFTPNLYDYESVNNILDLNTLYLNTK